jgi:cytochrome oxidase Cu insertion factor (SCO1/SenC/PrrC family)
MYQDTKSNPEQQPLVFAKIKGNKTAELKKDEFIWHAQYESILKITVAFVAVEKAAAPEDNKLFENSIKYYLINKGFKVISTVYYDDASTLKRYLTMK